MKQEMLIELEYSGLMESLQRFGERGLGSKLKKALIYNHKKYGADYTIKLGKLLVGDPRKHKFPFPPKLGKETLINLFRGAYLHWEDKEYYNAIEDYTGDPESDVSRYAQRVIEELRTGSV